MKKLSNRKLAVIIIILLSIISFPTLKSGYTVLANIVKKQIEENKSSYCRREYPNFIKKAITKEELQIRVNKILDEVESESKNSKSLSYYGSVVFALETNNSKIPIKEQLAKLESWRLKDTKYSEAYFDPFANKCTRKFAVSDELPWYRF